MKLTHGYYHLIAILTVAIWGLTFIATKVLIITDSLLRKFSFIAF